MSGGVFTSSILEPLSDRYLGIDFLGGRIFIPLESVRHYLECTEKNTLGLSHQLFLIGSE